MTRHVEWNSSSWTEGNRDLRRDDRMGSRRLFILLPAYNEEEGIEKLLSRIDRICQNYAIQTQLVIVNDGSIDRTRAVIRSFAGMPITLIDFPVNRGIAAVFAAGFKWILSNGKNEDFCVTFDADNTHNPYVVLDILDKLLDGNDIVIASRFQPGGGVVGLPWFRRAMSNVVAVLLQNFVGLPNVRDYSTFYRGYRIALIRKGFESFGDRLIEGQGFSAMATLLVKLGQLTDRIAEVPLRIRYDLKEGGSGLPILRTIRGYLRLLLRYWRGECSPAGAGTLSPAGSGPGPASMKGPGTKR